MYIFYRIEFTLHLSTGSDGFSASFINCISGIMRDSVTV